MLRPGSVISGHVVEAPLGSGGMGVVYSARHPRLNRSVALKVLHGSYARDRKARAAFDMEAEIAASLKHPNIVPVYDRNGSGDE